MEAGRGASNRGHHLLHKLLFLGVAVIGLLAGVQKGSADQIFACKDNTSGILFMYATAPSAGCGTGRTLITMMR
jgi:hypothetical protein